LRWRSAGRGDVSPGGTRPGRPLSARPAALAGIYTFNRFNPHDPIFRELGSPDTLEGKDMICEPTPGSGIGDWLKDGETYLRW